MGTFIFGFVLGFILGAVLRFTVGVGSWRDDPPTSKQMDFAQDLGIDIPPGCTKGELSDLITKVTEH